jgi:catechol 2,3-dioxygenase-like lactoylglutathione lyase family enzyme
MAEVERASHRTVSPTKKPPEVHMARVSQLGLVGISVRDLERMTAFYVDTLGFTITDDIPGRGVFLSGRPSEEHHEFVLGLGDTPSNAQQISFRVASLDDVRTIHDRLLDAGATDIRVVNHGIAIGCYFLDPEGNRIECYWSTGFDYPQPKADPIDPHRSNDEIMAELEALPAVVGSRPHFYGEDRGKRI